MERLIATIFDYIHDIAKVRPFVLRIDLEVILMQMGIEMMTWMNHCVETEQKKDHYVMQGRLEHELWVMITNLEAPNTISGDLGPWPPRSLSTK
ncbi:hypothetical protein ASPZODRAFT_577004 [Penicilliopsis zonata CBS 506.65]|uniref:Uncharacterized protein n=1 Tax=Penicilliopsis zonata CBS 506.65 TaxID=1073090 RepID=A0A1L9SE84_9EURO|nr:hypothetical protein ASPZODRAFT_577004 [Penicilliopsis zonata CBS 506.65]OJJ45354.1 hypothetical protein ASPZODRAFT_577004 [Penicilliopsis zonata CBS 506.65]